MGLAHHALKRQVRQSTVLLVGALTALAASCLTADCAHAQAIINVPPNRAPTSVGANTVLNLFDGGVLAGNFDANAGSTVNIRGGYVGLLFDANIGSTVNISGGTVEVLFDANSGSTVGGLQSQTQPERIGKMR